LIEYFLIGGYHSFTTIEEHGFRLFIESIRPDLFVPSADTITWAITKDFESVWSEVMTKLAGVGSKISLTLDCWTSDNKKSFMGVTAHWISDEWSMCECLLDFANVSNVQHTGNIQSLPDIRRGLPDIRRFYRSEFC
jgi:hypothetical protein